MAGKQTELVYTEKELAAIDALKAANGEAKSLKELGVVSGVMVSIMSKAKKFPEDPNVVIVEKEDVVDKCPVCGAKHAYKKYRLAD